MTGVPIERWRFYINFDRPIGVWQFLIQAEILERKLRSPLASTTHQGDAVVVIDADLQDPPELIPDFMNRWKNGYDVVYGKRVKRQGESFVKKTTAYFFYQAIQRVSQVKIPEDTGDFRLLSRRAVDALKGNA